MRGSLKIYNIYGKDNADPAEIIAVKEGFSWPALMFPFFWALYYFIWPLLLAIFVFNIALATLVHEKLLSDDAMMIIQFSVNLLVGFNAGEILAWWYKQKNYKFKTIIAEKNCDNAKIKFFSKFAH